MDIAATELATAVRDGEELLVKFPFVLTTATITESASAESAIAALASLVRIAQFGPAPTIVPATDTALTSPASALRDGLVSTAPSKVAAANARDIATTELASASLGSLVSTALFPLAHRLAPETVSASQLELR